MTEESQTPAVAPATETAAGQAEVPQPKTEAAAKAQEVGKKLTGFLGGLAEKAKNLNVNELAEKAKSLNMNELAEKAKQKVNEVKDKAAEINTGKTEAAVAPREEITAEQMKEVSTKVAAQVTEETPAFISAVLSDLGEAAVAKLKFDSAYVALTAKSFYCFTKSSDQFLTDIHPVSGITGFSLLPPRGDAAGKMTVSAGNGEIKLILSSLESYAKALLLYKKLREAMGK